MMINTLVPLRFRQLLPFYRDDYKFMNKFDGDELELNILILIMIMIEAFTAD